MKKIPALNDLRVFEVAGRLQNFRQAAEELSLTHSAISHRIRSLEDQLGVRLFERQNGVQLTDVGRELHRSVSASLAQLGQSIAHITQHHTASRRPVRLAVLPSFAAYWLLPRLEGFYRHHPDIDLQIQASAELTEIGERGADIAIRFGKGGWPRMHAQKWMDEFYFLVAAPALLQRQNITNCHALIGQTLLQHDNTVGAGASWIRLFKKLGLDPGAMLRRISFDDSNLVLQAARYGHGIAFERHSLVAGMVRENKLSRLFPFGLRSESHYYLVTDPHHAADPAIGKVLGWLTDEARAFAADHHDMLAQVDWLDDQRER